MEKIREADVVIDVCSKCGGMWLDDKEIDKLIKIGQQNEKDLKNKGKPNTKSGNFIIKSKKQK